MRERTAVVGSASRTAQLHDDVENPYGTVIEIWQSVVHYLSMTHWSVRVKVPLSTH
jgi:hypothetical protein